MPQITRRDFIKIAGVTSAALTFPNLLMGCGGGSGGGRTIKNRTLHFNLSGDGFLPDDEEYLFHIDGSRLPVLRHTAETLAASGQSSSSATHYIENVPLPSDRAVHLYLTQRSDNAGAIASAQGTEVNHGLALSFIHIPDEASGLSGSTANLKDAPGTISVQSLQTFGPKDIATTILYHHSNLMSFDADTGKTVITHIQSAEGFENLVRAIIDAGQHGWYDARPVLSDNDQPLLHSQTNEPIVQYVVKPEVLAAGKLALQDALNRVYNDPALQGVAYSTQVQEVATSSDTTTSSSQKASSGPTFRMGYEGRHPGAKIELAETDGRKVTLKLTNGYLRHLSAFIEFYDAGGSLVSPEGWTSLLDWVDDDTRARLESDTRKFLTLISPPNTIFAVEVNDASEEFSFDFPTNATQAVISLGGLGHGGPRDSAIEELGVALTSTFEIGIPSMLLAATAGYHGKGDALKSLYTNTGILKVVARIFFSIIWGNGDLKTNDVLTRGGIFLADLLAKKAAQYIITYIAEQIAESVMEDAIPFVGWAMNAVAIATTAAELAQTTAEVVQSPWLIRNRVKLSHNLKVTINHDPKDFEFPATATHY
ncbi:MAG: hypothetical protein KDD66_15950, partial [Bdellovibrionales bacterium]|nr:hypothetical protein [Bdellovibrionales bacterium]